LFVLFGATMACSSSIDSIDISGINLAELQARLDTTLDQEGKGPYIKAVLKSHPQKAIHEDFLRLIESGEITMEHTTHPDSAVAQITPQWDDNGKMFLSLTVGNEFFELHITRLWIVLSHEWNHAKEIRDGTLYVKPFGEKETEETARLYFEGEIRAFKAQCQFEQTIGFTFDGVACSMLIGQGERAFRMMYAEKMLERTRWSAFSHAIFDQASK